MVDNREGFSLLGERLNVRLEIRLRVSRVGRNIGGKLRSVKVFEVRHGGGCDGSSSFGGSCGLLLGERFFFLVEVLATEKILG